jgi:predicted glycosyltransferase
MGQLVRSRALVEALTGRFDVTFVMGGEMPTGVELSASVRIVAVPAVGLSANGQVVALDRRRTLDRTISQRRQLLLETYWTTQPHVLVIELFPFGRRQFLSELEPVLEEARSGPYRPRVYCSVRDILTTRPPNDDARVATLLERFFDGVLVHGDPAFARLEESFTASLASHTPVFYTGFARSSAPIARPTIRPGSIVVSTGGGVVGGPLLRCALDAHALLPEATRRRMAIVAGPFLAEEEWRTLRAAAKAHTAVHVLRSVRNLAGELKHAAGSVSQCGYNTAMDLLHSGVPALVVPHGDSSEDEQFKRARRLQALGLARVLWPNELTPARLAEEIDALLRFQPTASTLDTNGAAFTANLLATASMEAKPVVA